MFHASRGGIFSTAVLAAMALLAARSSAQTPVGSQFQVNTLTSFDSLNPAVAFHANGEFVVAYDTDDHVYGQRFSSAGSPVGTEFDVGVNYSDPMIAIGGNDNAVMCYMIDFPTLLRRGVGLKRYSSTGVALDPSPIFVDLDVARGGPACAADGNGDFVVAWPDYVYVVRARRYLADGTSVGAEFQISPGSSQTYDLQPSIAANSAGAFVVAWHRIIYGDPDPCEIRAQRLDSTGGLVGTEFAVNSFTTGCQATTAVAVDEDGGFIVFWNSTGSAGSDTSGFSIQGQRFAANATPVGSEFQVNSYTTGFQQLGRKAVAMGPGGEFIVVWHSDGSSGTDTSARSIQARRFNATANPIGAEFQVNSYTTSNQSGAAVGLAPNGDFVVAWSSDGSYGTDTDGRSIQAQRFAAGAPVTNLPALGPAGVAGLVVVLMGAAAARLLNRR